MSKEGKIIKKCLMPQCKATRSDILHKFPRKRLRWLQWLNAVQMSEDEVALQKRGGDLFLCNRHFRSEDYLAKNSKLLNQTAVPSLHLSRMSPVERCRSLPGVKICSAHSSDERRQTNVVEQLPATTFTSTDVEMTNGDVNPVNISECSEEDICEVNDNESTVSNPSFSRNPQATISSTTAISLATVPEVSTSSSMNSTTSNTRINGIKEEYMGLLSASEEKLKIYHNLVSSACNVDAKWLRGQCHCPECFDPVTHTFRIEIFDSVPNILPVMASILDHTRQLEIVWSDNHKSTYDLDKVVAKANLTTSARNHNGMQMERLLWSSQHTKYRDDFKPIHFQDIMLHKPSIKTAIDRLQRSGILLIDCLPETQNDVTMKKLCITKLFNCSMDNIVMERRSNFICKTGENFMPFTNCTFESIDKNIQIVTASSKIVEKIQLILVDGLHVAQQMQNRHSNDCAILKSVKQNFTYKHKQNYLYSLEKSVLVANDDDQIERIVFAPYHMTDIKHQNLDNFSTAMNTMSKFMKATENHWCIDLMANRLLVLDNYRICWNLKCLDENRPSPNLDCYYIERKHFLSCLHTLNVDI